LNALGDSRILTETRIKELGIIGGRADVAIPDVIILKNGENVADIKKGMSIRGKVDAVVDLKTEKKGITLEWGEKVAKRLGIGIEDIHAVGKGRNLSKSFATATRRGRLARSALKRGLAKTLGTAIAFAGVYLAWQDAKAQNMSDKQAALYAASSVVGGDLVYDAMKSGSAKYWALANYMARETAPGKHVNTIRNAATGKFSGSGPSVDATGKRLDALMRQKNITAGSSGLLIDQ
jgi:hypothetical protein